MLLQYNLMYYWQCLANSSFIDIQQAITLLTIYIRIEQILQKFGIDSLVFGIDIAEVWLCIVYYFSRMNNTEKLLQVANKYTEQNYVFVNFMVPITTTQSKLHMYSNKVNVFLQQYVLFINEICMLSECTAIEEMCRK